MGCTICISTHIGAVSGGGGGDGRTQDQVALVFSRGVCRCSQTELRLQPPHFYLERSQLMLGCCSARSRLGAAAASTAAVATSAGGSD
jgi:hypothetical protein